MHKGRWLSGKKPCANLGDAGLIPGWEDPLEKEMATHSSVLAWEIPWTEEPGGLQSTGWQRVRRDLVTKQQTTIWIHIHTCPPTPRSLSFALIIVTTIYIFLWYLDWGQNTCNVSGPTVSSKNEN